LIAPDAPIGAKVFITALAIVDDMGAVLVIAIFYSHEVAWSSLAGAAAVVVVLIGFNVARIRPLWPYLLAGIALWYFVHQSGVHATVAGVMLAFTIPIHSLNRVSERVTAPTLMLETVLHNISAFVVMPLFALANAGVKIGWSTQHAEITLGVLGGLVIGKPLGIMAAALLGAKSGIAKLPAAVGWIPLLGYASLA